MFSAKEEGGHLLREWVRGGLWKIEALETASLVTGGGRLHVLAVLVFTADTRPHYHADRPSHAFLMKMACGQEGTSSLE